MITVWYRDYYNWELGKISLPLNIRNQTLILILKEVTYILHIPFNFFLLACLKDKGYKWYHWLGKIQNKNTSRIIRSTLRQGNNYKIANFETSVGTALVTLITKPQFPYIIDYDDKRKRKSASLLPTFLSLIVDKEVNSSYNEAQIVAILDIWNWQMGHIDLLGLYKLGKECLRIRFKVKKSPNTLTMCYQKSFNRYYRDHLQIKYYGHFTKYLLIGLT